MSKNITVCKFGGSSLATAEQVKKVLGIVMADKRRRVVVVSAPGARFKGDTKVTDLLIAAAAAPQGSPKQEKLVKEITQRFVDVAAGWGLEEDTRRWVSAELGNRLGQWGLDTASRLDLIKSTGEDFSARLVARVARAQGVNAVYVSPKKAGLQLTDEPGNAQVLPKSFEKIEKALSKVEGIVIFPGFFGHTTRGKVITFSRGGSDVTGSVLARALNAPLYENWTDVDFIYSANPKVVSHPAPIEEITFQEMRELSYAGFGVLHDEALLPLWGGRTTVALKNTNNPAARGSRIVPRRKFNHLQPVVGIAGMGGGFANVTVEKVLMNREVGFGARLLGIFADEGLSFEHMPSGIDSVSVILRTADLSPAVQKKTTTRILKELKVDRVSVQRGISLVVVAGLGMRHTVGLAARACTALSRAGVNLLMINQGASEISLMFGIQEQEETKAIQALHQEFFGE